MGTEAKTSRGAAVQFGPLAIESGLCVLFGYMPRRLRHDGKTVQGPSPRPAPPSGTPVRAGKMARYPDHVVWPPA